MTVLEYEPALVEAAVLAALRGQPACRAFHDHRDPLYAIADIDEAEAAFVALHVRWFARLGLDHPLRQALDERADVETGCARCIVSRALTVRAEEGDLLVSAGELPTLVLRLLPGTLSNPDRALVLLRRELLHVADMLDPEFGYEPRLPSAASAPLSDRGRTERYRVLWDTYVDGRLVRGGRAPSTLRAERLREFAQAFPALAGSTEQAFDRFFDAEWRTHAELAAFAGAGNEGRPDLERVAMAWRPARMEEDA